MLNDHSVPSLKSQVLHDEASRTPSCQVVMGTPHPSSLCLVVPPGKAVHLQFPAAQQKRKILSLPNLLDNT